MGFRCGFVGLPNVGKSTLFNALTAADIPAENYPFCTIEPNIGTVLVPDSRLQPLADIVSPQRIVPAVVQMVDIAGLVAGASQGEGLGNKFLAHIRETQAIIHVVRCFEDTDVTHVSGRIDPVADVSVIETELILSDLDVAERALQKANRDAKSQGKQAQAAIDLWQRVVSHLNNGLLLRVLSLTEDEVDILLPYQLLTQKPLLYVANIGETEAASAQHLLALEEHAKSVSAQVVPVIAALEAEIAQLDEAERSEFLSSAGLQEPGLNRVVRAGYELLGLHTYFTAGPKELRAWTVPRGATAPMAAGVIHTDFEKGFIRAEVISYADFIAAGGELAAKTAGKWRLEGKDYVLADGDVILFRFNV